MKVKSALSYYGSDSAVAPLLAKHFDQCKHVTIPFVGGAAIIPHLKARTILANDKHEQAINFYRVISGRHGGTASDDLIAKAEHTLSHPAELRAAFEALKSESAVDRAWGYWAATWIGRKGKGGTKELSKSVSARWSPTGGNNASRLAATASELRLWATHFARCEWLCLDYLEILAKVYDDEACGLYVDAPWPGAGERYLHNFKQADHIDLRNTLDRFKQTKVLVRYGENETIRSLYAGWKFHGVDVRDQNNNYKGELWITNK